MLPQHPITGIAVNNILQKTDITGKEVGKTIFPSLTPTILPYLEVPIRLCKP